MDDFIPGIIWRRNSLKAQDYGVYENIILQDNISALLLENNGRS